NARQSGAESGEERAAVHWVDVVSKGEYGFRVAVVILQGKLHVHVVPISLRIERLGAAPLLVLVQMLEEFSDAASIMKLRLLVGALVLQTDGQSPVKEREFAQTLSQGVVIELNGVEDLGVRQEGDLRSAALCLACALQRGQGLATLVGLLPIVIPIPFPAI